MSNMSQTQSSVNVSLVSLPRWTEIKENAFSYPTKIVIFVTCCLAASIGSSWIKNQTKNLNAETAKSKWQQALFNNRNWINVLTHPFAKHPIKTSLLIGGVVFLFVKKS